MKFTQLLLGLSLILHGCKAPTPSPPKRPKKDKDVPDSDDFYTKFRNWNIGTGKIPEDVVAPFLGHGGTYESVQPVASKLKTIESDHAPHNSILEYVDPGNLDQLPENIQKAVKRRKELEDALSKTHYYANEKRMKQLKPEIDKLTKELDKLVPVNKWEKSLQTEYNDNLKKIKATQKEKTRLELEFKPGRDNDNTALDIELAKCKKTIDDLLGKNEELRKKAKAPIKTAVEDKLKPLEKEYMTLERNNKMLIKDLEVHNEHIKNAMGVLSIPYDKHRIFPSTGSGGLSGDIRALKNEGEDKAKEVMEEYDGYWKKDMDKGIQIGYFTVKDEFKKTDRGKIVYDYEAIWKDNFDKVIGAVEQERSGFGTTTTGKGRKGKRPASTPEQEYLTRVHINYAKKFMTRAIHYVKTPNIPDQYVRLVNLYIDEYKMYMKADFDSYKLGISQLLEANKQFGWIKDDQVKQIRTEHDLPAIGKKDTSDPATADQAEKWNQVEEIVKMKSESSKNPVLPSPHTAATSTVTGAGTVCSTSTRKKRSLGSGGTGDCIFYSKKMELEPDVDLEKEKDPLSHFDEDGFPKPKIRLPSDEDTVSIDSKRLTSYLEDLYGDDIDSVRTKQAVVEYASRHADKLTGTLEEVAAAKARLQHEDLDLHSEKTIFGTQLLRENAEGLSPKAIAHYKQMKISSSEMAIKLGKFTSATEKFSNPYGKIMLAKGIVTALRHGDYESLALMGGRIGLEFALSGVTKVGNIIARKATTKFMTKFGSEFLGKLAGPVGTIADIGINIYSITKSVNILNDPNASKFDRNDAIADIVADSIDIAVTATAAILSLAFPPLAPVFAAVAFVVNLLATIVVGFYKAANNVERINAQLPLLDYEKKREYWRYVTGDDTSAYIQELIDTKAANNIAVNTSVQFLRNNPDYIGRVFPSRTLYQPETPCHLEEKHCWKYMFFIPMCGDWYKVSDCNGAGGDCSGPYSGTKCQSEYGTGVVIPVIVPGYDSWEHRCVCGDQPPPHPQWGYEIPDNEVNFRSMQNVHLQRAAPDFLVPSDFTYLCKPSTLTDEGERVSRPETEWAYYCRNAIGIKRSNNAGKFMLYDLGNGTDSVHLDESETVDNLFVVNDGHKEYEGNAGDDTFLIDGPCRHLNGRLDGKGYRDHGNSLVLGGNCKPSKRLEVDLHAGTLHFEGYDLGLRSIQRVIGRRGKSDIIHADCDTKLIVGSGGASLSDHDEIYLPSSCATDTEITVAVEGSATVHAASFSGGTCFVLLQDKGLVFNARVPSSLERGTLLFKFQENVGSMTYAGVTTTTNGAAIELRFDGGGTAFFEVSHQHGPGENPIQILITENKIFSRHLSFSITPPGRLQAIHVLTYYWGPEQRIQGYDFMDNLFILRSGEWHVLGGQGRMNQFLLKSMEFSGSIDGTGTASGQSILQLHGDLISSPVKIDFNAGEIISNEGKFLVQNIQRFVGRPEYIEEVVVSCAVKYLELGGNVSDTVTIPNSDCEAEVRISAKGKLSVEDRKSSGATVIEAGYFYQSVESLDLEIGNFGGGEMVLLLNFPISALTVASSTLLNVGGGEAGKVKINGTFPNVYFEEDYNIKSALLPGESGMLVAYHELNVTDSFHQIPKLRKGSNVIPNIFKLENGKNWRVEGGNKDDVFSFVDGQFSGSLLGMGGRNQLVIGDSIPGDVKVKGSELLLKGHKALKFDGIQEIHGRKGQSEVVELGCDTLLLALNGGYLQKADQIIIPDAFACDSNFTLTILAMGFTQLNNMAASYGRVDTYLAPDANNHLKFKANIQVSPNLTFNFPIQLPSYKLSSYQLNIRRVNHSKSIESIQLKLNLMDDDNFLNFNLKGDYIPENTNLMFVDDEYHSNGNIFIDTDSSELYVLHILQSSQSDKQDNAIRRGAVGAKNVFRLYTGTWDAFGGALDDSFILNEDGFQGQIHGLQGVNSLVLTDKLEASLVEVDLSEETLKLDRSQSLTIKSIQIVGGRKGKKEIVHCGCDTKLIMLEGGVNVEERDEVFINDQPCLGEMEMGVVLTDFTFVYNLAKSGNFTYHVNVSQSSGWDIQYIATAETNHAIKLEMGLEKVAGVNLIISPGEQNDGTKLLEINFKDGGTKQFPLNYQRLPSLQIGTGPELVAEILFPDENMTDSFLRSSIIARTPFSGSIHGIHGVENGIIVKATNSLQGIFGGEKDDNIFLSEVASILVIDGGDGINRLQLSDELHRGLEMEVDFQLERIKFIENSSDLVTVVKGIALFVGREHSFERVIVGCGTRSVKWVDEVSIRNWTCGYNIKIEIGDSTRVMFESVNLQEGNAYILDEEEEGIDSESENMNGTTEEPYSNVTEEMNTEDSNSHFDEIKEENKLSESYLEPSEFHYHFTSIRSFDFEVDSFQSLRDTTHIFHLNFALANLTSIRFSLNDSRLIYSTSQDPSLEYSHLVGKLEDTAMFYSQPEFMTKEGFLLRITRYGEVMAVLGAEEETLENDFIHEHVIPGLTSQAERLGISFMVETANQFIYTGSTKEEEVDVLTNRVNTTSHLIGWNGTTYEILDMEKDTWIYPQQTHLQDVVHVLDLSSIVSQIRNETGHKYIPEVRENGTHLEIRMTNFTDKYPARVIIANGTHNSKSLIILLKSIAMEIEEGDRENPHEWRIKPRPITVPKGHSYILSHEDLEDGIEINVCVNDESNDNITYSKKDSDLVITSIASIEEGVGRFTSFVIFDHYEPRRLQTGSSMNNGSVSFGRKKSISNFIIKLGRESINVVSSIPVLRKHTGEHVHVEKYEHFLHRMEGEILRDFPEIPRRFNVSLIS